MGIGAASFVEGLQGGIAARDKMDMNKQYKRLLSDKADVADRDWQNVLDVEAGEWATSHGGDMSGYKPAARSKNKDPALMQFGGWLKNKFSNLVGGQEDAALEVGDFVSPELTNIVDGPTGGIPGFEPQEQQPMLAADGGIVPRQRYADGGEVEDYDDEVLAGAAGAYGISQRANLAKGAGAVGRGAAAAARGGRSLLGKVAGSKVGGGAAGLAAVGGIQAAAESAQTDTDEYRNMLGVSRERGGDLAEAEADADALYNRSRPEGYDELVEKVRGQGTTVYDTTPKEGVGDPWHWRNMLGFAKEALTGGEAGGDVLARTVGTMGKVGEKVSMGMLDSPSESLQGGIPSKNDAPTAAIGAALDEPEKTSEEVAQAAITDAEQAATENLDYQLLADQGVRPEELPSMNTSDWADYRSHLFQLEIGRGRSAKEAMESVDGATVDMQMKGMMRELDKAMLYLETGQASAASMAIRQGFQYFPNGVEVRFGTQIDPKTGRPVIIAMGTDEETGEPTGTPILITTDRLAAIRNQMSDPKSFNAWTKDGHELQLKVDQLQSQDDYRQGSLEISAYNAQTQRARANSAASGAGGMSLSEQRQRAGVFEDMLRDSRYMEEGMDDPDMLRDLASAMSIYQELQPQMNPNTIMAEIMGAYKSEQDVGVEKLLESKRGR